MIRSRNNHCANFVSQEFCQFREEYITRYASSSVFSAGLFVMVAELHELCGPRNANYYMQFIRGF